MTGKPAPPSATKRRAILLALVAVVAVGVVIVWQIVQRVADARPLAWHAERVQHDLEQNDPMRLLSYASPIEQEVGLNEDSFAALLEFWEVSTGCTISGFDTRELLTNPGDSQAELSLLYTDPDGDQRSLTLLLERQDGKPIMNLIFPLAHSALRALGDDTHTDLMEPERSFRILSEQFLEQRETLTAMGLTGCVLGPEPAYPRTLTWDDMSDRNRKLADHRRKRRMGEQGQLSREGVSAAQGQGR